MLPSQQFDHYIDTEDEPIENREFKGNVFLNSKCLRNIKVYGSLWIVVRAGYKANNVSATLDIHRLVDPGVTLHETNTTVGRDYNSKGIDVTILGGQIRDCPSTRMHDISSRTRACWRSNASKYRRSFV